MQRLLRLLGPFFYQSSLLSIGICSLTIASMCPSVSADTFSVNGTPPNVWPGQMSFTAPCGVAFIGTPGTASYQMLPPPVIDFSPQNTLLPIDLCAGMMRTLTDPSSVSVTSIGAVNPMFTGMPPNQTPLPPTTLVSGTAAAQPPQNAPTTVMEVSDSGTMEFDVPINFRDTSDTMFEGKFEGVLEVPYDAFKCPNLSATDTSTGLLLSTVVLDICAINTPSDYIAALTQGHTVGWAEFNTASVIAYGPADNTVPSNAQSWQRQTAGGQVSGMLVIPYGTNVNSTALRVGLRRLRRTSTDYLGWLADASEPRQTPASRLGRNADSLDLFATIHG